MRRVIKHLIIFLIRWRLGLKKKEFFRFSNQKSSRDVYFFGKHTLVKREYTEDPFYPWYNELRGRYKSYPANVSLNWLLSDDCKIEKVK